MIEKIYVIDDIIPKNYQELIKETIFDTYNHQWFLKKSLSESTVDPYPTESFVDAPGLVNVFYNKNGITKTIPKKKRSWASNPISVKACTDVSPKIPLLVKKVE